MTETSPTAESSSHLERVCAALVEGAAPAAVLVDGQGVVLHRFGTVSRFVGMPAGRATHGFLRTLNPEARTAVSTAMHRARKTRADVRYSRVRFGPGGGTLDADVTVKYLRSASDGDEMFLVLLGAVREKGSRGQPILDREGGATRVRELEEELQHTRETLQSTIEELETTNEALQSTNEALSTVNAVRHEKIEELTELTRDFENLLRSTGIETIFLDRELKIRKFTPQAGDVVPILASDLGRPIQHLSDSLQGVDLVKSATEVLQTGRAIECETLDIRGLPRLVRLLPYEAHGRREGVVLTLIDMTNVQEVQRSLEESEDRFQRMVEQLDQVFWMMSSDATKFTYVSPLIEATWGVTAADLAKSPSTWLERVHPDDRAAAAGMFDVETVEDGFELELRLAGPAGDERWMHTKASLVHGDDGRVVGIAGSARDITEKRLQQIRLEELAEELEAKALRDALTGLANRRGLEALLSRELARSRRSGGRIAAVLVDADDFKDINDSLGHTTGDIVLQGMARRMTEVLRPSDGLARVGGDEFLAVLPDTRLAEAVRVAERLRMAIADELITVGGEPVHATASLGVAMLASSMVSIEEILNATHEALEASKKAGKNRVVAATDGEGNRAAGVSGESRPSAELVSETAVEPYFQRIHRLVDGEVVGYEMLSRGPEGPFRSPGDFFRASHEHNLLTVVDLRCLKTCIEASAALNGDLPVHVNIFPSTLVDTPIERILELMEDSGGASRFCVELSEQQFLGAPAYLVEGVAGLKRAGARVAVDDVGYGRSSLEALVLLEPDVIKLAREFVKGVDEGVARRRGLARLATATRTLSTEIVAEGVETEGEREVLIELGVELAQGFLWDRPEPVGERGAAGP